MRVLYIAEIVGKSGIFTLKNTLASVRAEFKPDFVVGSGDGVTGGFGMGKNHGFYLHKLGMSAVTLGECAYFKKDLPPALPTMGFVLRPANFPAQSPGRGYKVFDTPAGRVAVISLLGQSGFSKAHVPSPFLTLDAVLEKIPREVKTIVVDFHAATTAEKNTFFHFADGKVSTVLGSHGKIVTADERLMPKGTAVITDAGRTGSQQSVQGFLPAKEISRFLTGLPDRSQESWEALAFQGVLVDIESNGRPRSIERIVVPCLEEVHESTRNDQED
jgi:metallophosphoesterase (TIGR00282 family)